MAERIDHWFTGPKSFLVLPSTCSIYLMSIKAVFSSRTLCSHSSKWEGETRKLRGRIQEADLFFFFSIRAQPENCTCYFFSYPIGQNLNSCLHHRAGRTGKCSPQLGYQVPIKEREDTIANTLCSECDTILSPQSSPENSVDIILLFVCFLTFNAIVEKAKASYPPCLFPWQPFLPLSDCLYNFFNPCTTEIFLACVQIAFH